MYFQGFPPILQYVISVPFHAPAMAPFGGVVAVVAH